MTAPHDDRRREPRLPPELAFVAERFARSSVPTVPPHLRGKVLGAVIDALGTDGLAEADLLPPSRREPWPAAVLLLSGLALALVVAPLLAAGSAGPAMPLPRFSDRLAAVGVALPAPVVDGDPATAPLPGDGAPGSAPRGRFAAGSIAALRSLPAEHWLKGTL